MSRLRRPPLGRVRDAALTRIEYARRAGRGSQDRRVVAIVGMHRSGTSAVAGTLQEAGLYLGSVLRRNESNRRGTREHLRIVELHDEILAYSGGSWRLPPAELAWTDEHRARRDAIVRSFAGAELWGFKDPRTVLLLDFWRESLGDSLELVGVFREPAAVVSSLLNRNGGGAEEWLALWHRHNKELLRHLRAASFPLLEFTAGRAAYEDRVTPILLDLGLRIPKGLRFFDSSLPSRQTDPSGIDVPRDVQQMFLELQKARADQQPR